MTQKGKTVVNCAFLCAKAQILRNVWKILRERTVARLHLLETLAKGTLRSKVDQRYLNVQGWQSVPKGPRVVKGT